MSHDQKGQPLELQKKKTYIRPEIEVIELRSDERIAKSSGQNNCKSCQGTGQGCAPGGNPGGGQ